MLVSAPNLQHYMSWQYNGSLDTLFIPKINKASFFTPPMIFSYRCIWMLILQDFGTNSIQCYRKFCELYHHILWMPHPIVKQIANQIALNTTDRIKQASSVLHNGCLGKGKHFPTLNSCTPDDTDLTPLFQQQHWQVFCCQACYGPPCKILPTRHQPGLSAIENAFCSSPTAARDCFNQHMKKNQKNY
jgi:hypothetical protein